MPKVTLKTRVVWNTLTPKWQFSPSYDLMFSMDIYGEHTMTVNGEGKRPSLSDVVALAAYFDIEREAEQVVLEVNSVVCNVMSYLDEAVVSDKSKRVLEGLITQVK